MTEVTYNIYRDEEKIAEGIEGNTYTDTDVTPNTQYRYQISSQNIAGESELSDPITVTTDYSPVEDLTLSKGSLELEIGDSEQLSVTVSPSTARQDVEWLSDNELIATVDTNGNVEAISEGEAIITVRSEADPEVEDACVVTVVDTEPEPEPDPDPEIEE